MKKMDKIFNSKLIFGKYQIKDLIKMTSNSKIYLGINIKDKNNYAIKIEDKTIPTASLKEEALILYLLKGPGLPKVISFGHVGKYNILVENLLGKSISDIWLERKQKFNLKDLCMFAFQGLERIEYVHSKNYLHRDIKPGNFLVGNPDTSQIYLIDFGNAKKFKSSRTGKHMAYNKICCIFGTLRYLSSNTLKGIVPTRKDDLESFGLVLIHLYIGNLPWINIKNKNGYDEVLQVSEIRKKLTLETLCKGMPSEMYEYMKYVQNLNFEQNPDYNYLRSLFLNILQKIGEKNDFIFSWVDKSLTIQKINGKSKGKTLKKIYEKIFANRPSKSNFNKKTKTPEKTMANNDNIKCTTLNCTNNNSIEKNNQIDFIEKNINLNNYSSRLNNLEDESNIIYENINDFLPKNTYNNKRKKNFNVKKINIQIPNLHNSLDIFNKNFKEVRSTDTNKFTLINDLNINDKEKRENSKLKIYRPYKNKILALEKKKIKNYIYINNVNIYKNNNNFTHRKIFKDRLSKLISNTNNNINDEISKYLSKEINY